MKTEYLTRKQLEPSLIPLAVRNIMRPYTLAFSGMWSCGSEQWRPLQTALTQSGARIEIKEFPGHGTNQSMQLDAVRFEDCLAYFEQECKQAYAKMYMPINVVAHSFAVPVMLSIASAYPSLFKRIIGINPAPISTNWSLTPKYLRLQYISALLDGSMFYLHEKEHELVADGSGIPLGPESGHLLRKVTLGIKAPSVPKSVRSMFIVSKNDSLIPDRLRMANIAHYKPSVTEHIDCGGHFCHFHADSRDEVTKKICNFLNN